MGLLPPAKVHARRSIIQQKSNVMYSVKSSSFKHSIPCQMAQGSSSHELRLLKMPEH